MFLLLFYVYFLYFLNLFLTHIIKSYHMYQHDLSGAPALILMIMIIIIF